WMRGLTVERVQTSKVVSRIAALCRPAEANFHEFVANECHFVPRFKDLAKVCKPNSALYLRRLSRRELRRGTRQSQQSGFPRGLLAPSSASGPVQRGTPICWDCLKAGLKRGTKLVAAAHGQRPLAGR